MKRVLLDPNGEHFVKDLCTTFPEKDLTKEPGAGYLGTIMLKTRKGNYIMQQLIISKDGEDMSIWGLFRFLCNFVYKVNSFTFFFFFEYFFFAPLVFSCGF